MRYRHVVFDIDDTLTDSTSAIGDGLQMLAADCTERHKPYGDPMLEYRRRTGAA